MDDDEQDHAILSPVRPQASFGHGAAMTATERVLDRLDGVKPSGPGRWIATMPGARGPLSEPLHSRDGRSGALALLRRLLDRGCPGRDRIGAASSLRSSSRAL